MNECKNYELNSGKDMALYFDFLNRDYGVCPRDMEKETGFVLYFDLNSIDVGPVVEDLEIEAKIKIFFGLRNIRESLEEIFKVKVVVKGDFKCLHVFEDSILEMNNVYKDFVYMAGGELV